MFFQSTKRWALEPGNEATYMVPVLLWVAMIFVHNVMNSGVCSIPFGVLGVLLVSASSVSGKCCMCPGWVLWSYSLVLSLSAPVFTSLAVRKTSDKHFLY